MARVEIALSLYTEIEQRFKGEAHRILDLMERVGEHPKKGKFVGNVGAIAVKEIKYRSFRFYFIADGYKIKFLAEDELTDLLLRFVRMSNKKSQQKTIAEIKDVLLRIGPTGFS